MTRIDSLKNFNGDAGGFQDQPRPGARAPVGEVAARVKQARRERQRAEDDRVDTDGGNEEKDRSPPVEGRQAPSFTSGGR